MAYLTKDFIKFFQDLEKNNHKLWFDQARKRYESSVKIPFTKLIDEMIGRINADDPTISITAKDAVMRINRDIRFSQDKTPYNCHYGAIISSAGRKDKSIPGIFYRFSAEKIEIYGGAYGIDKHQLQNIRKYIQNNLDQFNKVIQQKLFKETFGEILGEKNKRVPPEFHPLLDKQPLIANKQFYYGTEIPAKYITEDQLPDILMSHWYAGNPVRKFLLEALKLPK